LSIRRIEAIAIRTHVDALSRCTAVILTRKTGLKVYALPINDAVRIVNATDAKSQRVDGNAVARHLHALSIDTPLSRGTDSVGHANTSVINRKPGIASIAITCDKVESLAIECNVGTLTKSHVLPLNTASQW
jgi:hypothetical protein